MYFQPKNMTVVMGMAAVVGVSLVSAPLVRADDLQTSVALESADIGWATQNGGTTGGVEAADSHIYLVDNITDLKYALKHAKSAPSIIQIQGSIDVSNGKAYRSYSDQKKRSQLSVPSDTTIIGVDGSAEITNGSLVMNGVENIIIRNLHIETPVDVAPEYESGDGWNAHWDSMTIKYSTNIWVDHVTFNDGDLTDDQYDTVDGETYVQHDGMLDITHGSDYITVSYSWFRNHDKVMLIGHSKNNSDEDSGHLRVTLADNIFATVTQRTPRVRFGEVHAFNNIFKGDDDDDVYPYSYSYGMGYEGSLISDSNAFEITNLDSSDHCKIFKTYDSDSSLKDSDSIFNGSELDLSSECSLPGTPSWSIPYSYTLRSASDLDDYLEGTVGAGKLSL